MKRFFTYLLGISISMSAIGAQAATTYQYTGNNFGTVIDNTPPVGTYTTSMSVTGSFTVTSALAAMTSTNLTALIQSYSFSDGRNTLTESNSSAFGSATTDGTGQITSWNFTFITPQGTQVGDQQLRIVTNGNASSMLDLGEIAECTDATNCELAFEFDRANLVGQPGSWSVVPVPAAVWLFGSGLLGLVGLARRQ